MNDVNIIRILVQLIPEPSLFVLITPESFNHHVRKAEQWKVEAEPDNRSVNDPWDNEAARLEPWIEQEKDVNRDRDPGNWVGDEVKYPAFRFGLKYLQPEAQGPQQKNHEVNQYPFVLKIEQSDFCPAPKAEDIHAKTVYKSNYKGAENGEL